VGFGRLTVEGHLRRGSAARPLTDSLIQATRSRVQSLLLRPL